MNDRAPQDRTRPSSAPAFTRGAAARQERNPGHRAPRVEYVGGVQFLAGTSRHDRRAAEARARQEGRRRERRAELKRARQARRADRQNGEG